MPEGVDVRFGREITLPRPFEVIYSQSSEELSAEVLIAREQQRPRWSDQLRFGRTEYELFVVFVAPEARLLFICASRRADSMYRAIATEYIGEAFKGLPLYMINRVLSGLSKVECFSVGCRGSAGKNRRVVRYRASNRRQGAQPAATARMANAKPKLDALAAWMDARIQLISGKGDLAKAIR